MISLVLCPSCSRHVRASEVACPFCAHALPEGLAPAPYARQRKVIGKGATALALALAAAGCSEGATAGEELLDVAVSEAATDSAATDSAATDGAADSARDTSASDVSDDGSSFPIYK